MHKNSHTILEETLKSQFKLKHLLALMLLFAGSFSFAQSKKADSYESKVDPAVFSEFAKISSTHALAQNAKSDLTLYQESEKRVRVIVQLHDTSNTSFESIASDRSIENPMAVVANAVEGVQNDFYLTLQQYNLLLSSDSESAATGFEPVLPLTYQYAVAGYIDNEKTLAAIAKLPEVKYVEFDKLNELYDVEGRAVSGSAAQAANGHRGQGVGVAVIDSHFDLLHPQLGGSTNLPNGVVYDGRNYSDPGTSIHSRNMNDCYHGTGTASIVNNYAPDADLYLLTVFPNAFDSVIADAINWCVTNRNGSNGGAPIRVISMSLGGGQHTGTCNTGLMHQAAGTALSNGIMVFAASGNNGWVGSMGSPACSSNVVSIGSTWDANQPNYSAFPPAYCNDSNRQLDERTCYTNTNALLDLYAPSEEVICARCGGGTVPLGGTSSACPAAAGLAAQFLSADASFIGNQSGLVSRFQSTGAPVIGDTGKRRIDLTAALGGSGGGGGGGGGGSSDLANGSPVSVPSTNTGGWQYYTIDIPSGASNLSVSISGGSGDADLYLRRGSQPTQSSYDCRPYRNGNNESCSEASPQAGTWHVGIRAYSSFSGVTLQASWDTGGGSGGGGNQGFTETGLSASRSSWIHRTVDVTSAGDNMVVTISGSSGDADLYVRYNARPTTSNWDYRPYLNGSNESVTVNNAQTGTWHISVRAYSAFSGLTLDVDFQ
jgi:serine protease